MVNHEPHVIDGTSFGDISYVSQRMREADMREARCLDLDGRVDCHAMVRIASDAFTAYYRGRPTFVFGTVEVLPGVRQLFGFGTDATLRVMPAVTWFTESYWLPELYNQRVRRIQAIVPTTNDASLKWLEGFGMFRECVMHDYAVNGTPMVQLAFTLKEFATHVLLQEESRPGSSDRPGPGQDECRHTGGG